MQAQANPQTPSAPQRKAISHLSSLHTLADCSHSPIPPIRDCSPHPPFPRQRPSQYVRDAFGPRPSPPAYQLVPKGNGPKQTCPSPQGTTLNKRARPAGHVPDPPGPGLGLVFNMLGLHHGHPGLTCSQDFPDYKNSRILCPAWCGFSEGMSWMWIGVGESVSVSFCFDGLKLGKELLLFCVGAGSLTRLIIRPTQLFMKELIQPFRKSSFTSPGRMSSN